MPQFICSSCKTGLYSAARPADQIDARCPVCRGSSGEARPHTRVSGGRSTTRGRRPGPIRTASADRQRIAERFDALMDRVRATRARLDAAATSDADRWADDGGSFSAAGAGRHTRASREVELKP
jgi:hypothetical protein